MLMQITNLSSSHSYPLVKNKLFRCSLNCILKAMKTAL